MRQKAARIALAWVYPLFLLLTLGGAAILTTGCSSGGDDTPELLGVSIPVDFPALARAISPYATRVDWNLDPLVGNGGGTARSGSIARQQDGAHTVTGTTTATGGDYALTLRAYAGSAPDPIGTVTQNITIVGGAENSFNFSANVSDSFADGGTIEVSGPASVDVGATAQYTVVGKNADGDVIISAITENVTWSTTGGVGSVDGDGTFTGTAAGNGTVDASVGGKSDSAPVTVNSVGPQPGNLTVKLSWAAKIPARDVSPQTNSVAIVVYDATNTVVATTNLDRANDNAHTTDTNFNLAGGNYTVSVQGYQANLNVNGQVVGNAICSTNGLGVPVTVNGATSLPISTDVKSLIAGYRVWYVLQSASNVVGGAPPAGAIEVIGNAPIQCTFDPNPPIGSFVNTVKLYSQSVDAANNIVLAAFDTNISYSGGTGNIVIDNALARFNTSGIGAASFIVGAPGNPTRTVGVNITGVSGNGNTLLTFEFAGSCEVATMNNAGGIPGTFILPTGAAGEIGATYLANVPGNTATDAFYTGTVLIRNPQLTADGKFVVFTVYPQVDPDGTGGGGAAAFTLNRGDIWSCRVNQSGVTITFDQFKQQTPLGDAQDDGSSFVTSDGTLFWSSNTRTLAAAPNTRRNGPGYVPGSNRHIYKKAISAPAGDISSQTAVTNNTFPGHHFGCFVTPNMGNMGYIRVDGADTGVYGDADNALAAGTGQVLYGPMGGAFGAFAASGIYATQRINSPAFVWERGSGRLLINNGAGAPGKMDSVDPNNLSQFVVFQAPQANQGFEIFLDDPSTVGVLDPKLVFMFNNGANWVFRFPPNVATTNSLWNPACNNMTGPSLP